MKRLAELRKRLGDLKAEGLQIVEAAESADRDMTEAEEARYDEIKAAVAETEAAIARTERLIEERRAMTVPANSTFVSEPNPATTGGFRSLGEFAVSVRRASVAGGQVDPRLLASSPSNVHTGGAATGEGYMVPAEYRDGIWEVVQQLDDFGPLVDEEPTLAREVKLNVDETTPWGSTGVLARWRSEGAQMTPSKLVTDPRTVPLHELYAFVLATDELLEDAPRLASRLTRRAGEAIAWKKTNAMIYGSGAGQPLGWMSSGALVTVAKTGGQAADTINVDNVLAMYSRLLTVPGDSPFWLTNRDTVPQLAKLVVGDTPVWLPPNGVTSAPGGYLLGLPIRFSEQAKTLGDLGDIQLISPKGYYALRRDGGPKYAQSMHLYFDYAIEAFRWTFRFGGQPYLSAPVAAAHGPSSKSHFVTLAERA